MFFYIVSIGFTRPITAMSLTAEITAYLFSFVIFLYTSNIYYIVLLCTDIWSFFDT